MAGVAAAAYVVAIGADVGDGFVDSLNVVAVPVSVTMIFESSVVDAVESQVTITASAAVVVVVSAVPVRTAVSASLQGKYAVDESQCGDTTTPEPRLFSLPQQSSFSDASSGPHKLPVSALQCMPLSDTRSGPLHVDAAPLNDASARVVDVVGGTRTLACESMLSSGPEARRSILALALEIVL